MKNNRRLKPQALYHSCDLSQFAFNTTADIEPLDQPLGQQRALEAIEFGVDIDQHGFNLFVLGPSGLGKHELVKQLLAQRAAGEPAGADWCYVNNFEDPQKPRVLQLPVGMGSQLRKDMRSLVEDLLLSLPASFQSEEYHNRRQEIEDELTERQEQAFKKLNEDAEQQGIAIMRTPRGYTLGPTVDGKLLDPVEYKKLSPEDRERIEKLIDDIQLQLQAIIRDLPLLQREHHQRIKELNREFTQHTVEQLMAAMENTYRDQPDVMAYLEAVRNFAIDNVEAFLPQDDQHEIENVSKRAAEFHEFSINVIVDNTGTDGAPIVFEDNPTYQNLIGRIEYMAQMGTLVTNFTLIKSGALHRANGGYLILDALKILTHAFSWEGLKRVLKAHKIKIQSLEQMLSLASNVSLEPESIPLDVKVVLTGEPILYYLLKAYDPEFSPLFKVVADFSHHTERSSENSLLYARLIAAIQNREGGRPLDKAGVGRVIEQASRAAEDSEKLSLQIESLRDLLSEADYWASKDNSQVIGLLHVNKAIDKRLYRQDKYRELLQEQVVRGIKLIDTEGAKVAQVNGLSVLQIGDYMFGQPSRITATARLGRGGVIDIERESKLGGHIHSKGVMILSSYLASRYAAEQPLPLSASLVFEQSYGMVEGDSASAAELCVLLSALGNMPLDQSIAVTGSINQLGEIQAIGGVNEKIEGFYDICQMRGLTRQQGVIIPAANEVHLMLREDIRQAVADNQFSIFIAEDVEDVMEILSGLPRGEADDEGNFSADSFNFKVQQRVAELQKLMKRFGQSDKQDEASGEKSNDADS